MECLGSVPPLFPFPSVSAWGGGRIAGAGSFAAILLLVTFPARPLLEPAQEAEFWSGLAGLCFCLLLGGTVVAVTGEGLGKAGEGTSGGGMCLSDTGLARNGLGGAAAEGY